MRFFCPHDDEYLKLSDDALNGSSGASSTVIESPLGDALVDKGRSIVSMGSALNRKLAYFLIFSLLVPVLASAQSTEMVSAEKFFANLSENYSKVKDYEANLTITQGKAVSRRHFVQVTPVPVHQVRRPRKTR